MTGILFIVATVAALAAAQVVPDLTGSDYLVEVAHHPGRLAGAALLYLLAAGTSVGIAIALYPVVQKASAGLALAAVVFRTIEAVFYLAAIVSLLSLGPLAQKLGTDGDGAIRTLADSVLDMRERATLLGVCAFCTGALMYYVALFRARLVPHWLSGWGAVAIFSMAAACVLALLSNRPITGYVPFILPILVQEMVLAVWLLVKGFSATSTTDAPAYQTSRVVR